MWIHRIKKNYSEKDFYVVDFYFIVKKKKKINKVNVFDYNIFVGFVVQLSVIYNVLRRFYYIIEGEKYM